VLRRGADARAYGSLLLEVGRGARLRRLAIAAFAEPTTSLERRIHRLTDALRAPRRRQALGLAAAAAALLVVAMCAREPTPPRSSHPAATLATQDDINAGPVFTPFTVAPQLKNRVEVQKALEQDYPPLLKDAGIGGTVMVWFFIDAQGRVAQARIKESSGQAPLDSAALHVARSMVFEPAANGSAGRVPVWVALPIVFRTD
jgi:TonB family protein